MYPRKLNVLAHGVMYYNLFTKFNNTYTSINRLWTFKFAVLLVYNIPEN